MSEQVTITKEKIDAYRQSRLREFSEKLTALTAEYNCDLVAVPKIENGQIVAIVQIVSKD